MKLLRAVGIGIVLWVLIFFEVSILMFGFKLSEGTAFYVVHYILLVLFAVLMSLWYFWHRRMRGGFFRGLWLGVMFVFVGVVLDSIITIPLWIIPQGGSHSEFLLNPGLLVGELIIFFVCWTVGAFKK